MRRAPESARRYGFLSENDMLHKMSAHHTAGGWKLETRGGRGWGPGDRD